MTVLPMSKVFVVTRACDRDKLMCALQEAGVLHISPAPLDHDYQSYDKAIEQGKEVINGLDNAISFLERFLGTKLAIPKKILDDSHLLQEVLKLKKSYDSCSKCITSLKNDIDFYSIFGDFTDNCETLDGLGLKLKLAVLKEKDQKLIRQSDIPFQKIASDGQEEYFAIFLAPFDEVTFKTFDPPKVSIKQMKEELIKQTDFLKDLEHEAGCLSYQLPTLKAQRNEAIAQNDRFLALQKTTLIDGLLALQGYVLQRDIDSLKSVLQDQVAAFRIEDPNHNEDVPVKLDNAKAISGFEAIIKSFTGISYFEKDKTFIVSLLFMFFGSLCLMDAGYGVLLLGLGYLLAIKKNKEFGQVFMWTGAITTVMGLLNGQIFGLLLSKDIFLNLKPLMSLATDPLACFKFSLVVGVFAMMLANIVAMVQNGVRTHSLGCLFAIMGTCALVAHELYLGDNGPGSATSLLQIVGISFGILCLLSWLLFPEPVFGPDKRLPNILWTLYSGPIGLVQDILSHMRLFGIALSGAILALVVNKIAAIMPALMGALFVPMGHFLVFLLSLLSLYIHTNRLIFLEFGSKCMRGGNNYFKPFARRI